MNQVEIAPEDRSGSAKRRCTSAMLLTRKE
jgi:hypothetical protein